MFITLLVTANLGLQEWCLLCLCCSHGSSQRGINDSPRRASDTCLLFILDGCMIVLEYQMRWHDITCLVYDLFGRWSESTGPWKLLHTCPKCPKSQIVPWLRTIIGAMSRSARHNVSPIIFLVYRLLPIILCT